MVDWLVDWMNNWMIDWLIDWLIGWLVGLCFQLWTLYCDQNKNQAESSSQATSIIMEFWGKVTPGILHLLVQAEDVSTLGGGEGRGGASVLVLVASRCEYWHCLARVQTILQGGEGHVFWGWVRHQVYWLQEALVGQSRRGSSSQEVRRQLVCFLFLDFFLIP